MNTGIYTQLLLEVIKNTETKIEPKNTVLAIWKSQEHLNEWVRGNKIDKVSILNAPSNVLPMMKPEGVDNPEDAAMIGVAVKTNDDQNYLKIIMYLTVTPNGK